MLIYDGYVRRLLHCRRFAHAGRTARGGGRVIIIDSQQWLLENPLLVVQHRVSCHRPTYRCSRSNRSSRSSVFRCCRSIFSFCSSSNNRARFHSGVFRCCRSIFSFCSSSNLRARFHGSWCVTYKCPIGPCSHISECRGLAAGLPLRLCRSFTRASNPGCVLYTGEVVFQW